MVEDNKLSTPEARSLLHKRSVDCYGYLRDDGLYDIEGHLIDVKTYTVEELDRGPIPPGEPIHEMWLRLTIDNAMEIVEVEAKTVWSPYSICSEITPNFKKLKGIAIRPGFILKTRQLLGGINGCTHLVELLGPIATTAFQTVYPHRARKKNNKKKVTGHKPALLNSCHAWSDQNNMIERKYPDFYKGISTNNGDLK